MSENPYLPEDVDPREIRAAEHGSARAGCLSANAVTFVFLVLTLLFLIYFGTLLANPYLPINPFPPRTPLPVYVVASPNLDATAQSMEPTKPAVDSHLTTLVPTITPVPTDTLTPLPTATLMAITPPPVATRTAVFPTATLVGAAAPNESVQGAFTPPAPVNPEQVTRSPYPFTLHKESVTYIPNPGEQSCRWASIAGTVVNLEGLPISGLAVRVQGEGIDEIRFTGTALQYGLGGYEVFLNGTPLEGQYTIRLLSHTGVPISDELVVATVAECEQNVAVVNFVQNHAY